MNNNINDLEADFLNNKQKEKKKSKINILNILYYILKGFLYIIYIIVNIFCLFIESIFFIGFLRTATKTAYKRKRRKVKIL